MASPAQTSAMVPSRRIQAGTPKALGSSARRNGARRTPGCMVATTLSLVMQSPRPPERPLSSTARALGVPRFVAAPAQVREIDGVDGISRSAKPSDRHFRDILVGLNDAVAHCDHRLQRDVALLNAAVTW